MKVFFAAALTMLMVPTSVNNVDLRATGTVLVVHTLEQFGKDITAARDQNAASTLNIFKFKSLKGEAKHGCVCFASQPTTVQVLTAGSHMRRIIYAK